MAFAPLRSNENRLVCASTRNLREVGGNSSFTATSFCNRFATYTNISITDENLALAAHFKLSALV
jgi:hypothetical protein